MATKKTKAQLESELGDAISNARRAFDHGVETGRLREQASFNQQKETIRLQQQQAAAKLMEEIGRMASRVGYMIDKVNAK